MSRRLCADLLGARATALEEAASHLEMRWTDDNLDYSQGLVIAEELRKKAAALYDKAAERL